MWKGLWSFTRTSLRYGTAYHPQSQGQVERMNSVVEQMIRCLLSDHTLREKPAPTNRRGTIVEPSWAVIGPSWGTSLAPRCFDDTSTTLPRRDHVGVVAFVHIACLAALVAAIMEATVEVSWKCHGQPRYSTRCVLTDLQCSIVVGWMGTITCSKYVTTFFKKAPFIYA